MSDTPQGHGYVFPGAGHARNESRIWAVILLCGCMMAAEVACGLLDMNPNQTTTRQIRDAIEADGDQLADLHLWRLGVGHPRAIVSIVTTKPRSPDEYRARLAHLPVLSHVTVEVLSA